MKDNVPYHLGIIIDGNRRWAAKRGLPAIIGHRQGSKNVKKIGKLCRKAGVKILTLYAFSTENWSRPEKEVNCFMGLIIETLGKKNIRDLHKDNIKIRIIGQKERFSKPIRKLIKEAEELTKNNKNGILNVALSYGGRAEIIEAVKKIIKKKIPLEKINEKLFEENLWTEKQPFPDLIIRTGGVKRLSNFLPWQSAYSELYFSDKYWPDFTEKDLNTAFEEYNQRQRRFGR